MVRLMLRPPFLKAVRSCDLCCCETDSLLMQVCCAPVPVAVRSIPPAQGGPCRPRDDSAVAAAAGEASGESQSGIASSASVSSRYMGGLDPGVVLPPTSAAVGECALLSSRFFRE